jgi:class 3 adenylate cyclase
VSGWFARLTAVSPRLFGPAVWAVAAASSVTFAAVHAMEGEHPIAEGASLVAMLAAVAVAAWAYLVVLSRRGLRSLRDSVPVEPDDDEGPPPVPPEFARYFSPQVSRVLAEQGPSALLPARREITVLFADLSGFTRYSEVASAEDTVATLTHYLDELVRVAHVHDGTIDKFMGDEIMVLFGTPLPQSDHAARAIACARDMQVVVGLLNEERGRRKLATLGLTVGVNSGDCVVGNVGGESRVQFSAIGDGINVAKRIQGLASRGEIVVGETTLVLAGAPLQGLEEHFVKGRGRAVRMQRIQFAEAPSPLV